MSCRETELNWIVETRSLEIQKVRVWLSNTHTIIWKPALELNRAPNRASADEQRKLRKMVESRACMLNFELSVIEDALEIATITTDVITLQSRVGESVMVRDIVVVGEYVKAEPFLPTVPLRRLGFLQADIGGFFDFELENVEITVDKIIQKFIVMAKIVQVLREIVYVM